MKKNLLFEIACSLIMIMFLYAAITKVMDVPTFFKQMKVQPFPDILSKPVAILLLIWESAIVVCLFMDRWRSIGLKLSIALMSIFTLYTGLILANVFEKHPCGCGGVISQLTWGQHLLFNLFFLGLSWWALKSNSRNQNMTQSSITKVYPEIS